MSVCYVQARIYFRSKGRIPKNNASVKCKPKGNVLN
jgi:hypothetical protein